MENMIQIKIENFEGPLDLLLHLIEKKKMDINSINVSQIIDDYLNYIHAQKELNLKIKVEFLIMATDLIEIKAYSILNKDKKFEKIENLEKKIIEYQLFKEISELFSKYENEYNVPYTRTGTESIGSEIEYDISSLNLDNLFKSLKNLTNSKMIKKNNFEERMILNLEDDNYSTEEAHNEISEIIKGDRKVEFNHLLKNKFSKSRIVTLFLCILDMFKNAEIDINATLSTRGSFSDPAMRLPPKNVHSIRKVKLDARAVQIINHFITANQARRLWKSKFADLGYIFVTDGGLPYDLHYVNRTIKKLSFPKPVSTHTFRHTHISILAESNVPLKAIMERVGHNEPRTTLAIYTHVTDEMKQEVNAAITNMGKALSNK